MNKNIKLTDQEVKHLDLLNNFIEYWSSDDAMRERMYAVAHDFVTEVMRETEMGAILEFVESSYDFPKTDYVLYNRLNNSLLKDSFGCIIVYGDRQEASADRHDNELVISCNQLPSDLRRELLKQINNK